MPKAFANLSPGFELQREPWDIIFKSRPNPERVKQLANPFRVSDHSMFCPRVVTGAPTPWDIIFKSRPNPERVRQLANRFRVSDHSMFCPRVVSGAPTLGRN